MSILDMLFQMVEKQKEFQKFLGNTIPKFTEDIYKKENIDNLTFQILAMFDEISEALSCLPWKPWKINQRLDINSFWEELMDILHFLINCCLFAGMSSEVIFAEFMKKNKKNWERQKNGY